MDSKQQVSPRSYTPFALAVLAFVLLAVLVAGRYISNRHNDSVIVTTTIQNLGPCNNTAECDTMCRTAFTNGFGVCDVALTCQCRYQAKNYPPPFKPRCVADISEGCNKTCQGDCCNDKCAHQFLDGRGFCSSSEPFYVVALCSCDYSC